MKGIGAAAVIVNDSGHVLLVKHTYGMLNWEIPGGMGELNESPSETAEREVLEETGLKVVAKSCAGWFYERATDISHAVFVCEQLEVGAAPKPDLDEISECRFWPPEALPRPLSDFTELRIRSALAGDVQPLPTELFPRKWLE